jgi:hypothetical protein
MLPRRRRPDLLRDLLQRQRQRLRLLEQRLRRMMRAPTLWAFSVGVALVSVGVARAAATTAAPGVRDAQAANILVYSAWGRENDVTRADCAGTGSARLQGALRQHVAFRCTVVANGKPGIVDVRAMGPEWLRVTSIVEGKLQGDPGIGAVPRGAPVLESFWAGGDLQDSAWAKAHGVATVFCFGVGAYQQIGQSGYEFYADSCATLGAHGRRGAQLLVVANGADNVKIVRTLAP